MKIKDLLKSSNKWTKGAYARDIKGNHIVYDDPGAHSFCLSGACQIVYKNAFTYGKNNEYLLIKNAIIALFPERQDHQHDTIPYFNDHKDTTFADIQLILEKTGV